jgi:DNA-directed RNA polymerase specialized sigma24 family protein
MKMPGFTCDPKVDSFKGWLLTVTQWKIADQYRKRSGVKDQSLLTSAATDRHFFGNKNSSARHAR